MKKFIHQISALVLGTILAVAPFFTGIFPMRADATIFDMTNQATIFQNLPVCNAARDMSRAAITDGPASPAMGQIVSGGGGTSHDLLLCSGTASTPNWIVIAGGSGSNGGTNQTVAMAAPTTTSGNYGTGSCSTTAFIADGQHSCLTFDDHWSSSTLQNGSGGTTKFWYEGFYICNNQAGGGAAENCGPNNTDDGVETVSYPFTTFGLNSGIDGVFTGATYGAPATNVTGVPTPLIKAADNTLQFSITSSTFINSNTTYCNGAWCNSSKWVAAALTSGGLTGASYPTTVANTAAIIPGTGGMLQWRAKMDNGLSFGVWPGLECDGVGTNLTTKGNNTPNANFEFGYNFAGYTGNPLTNVAFSMNNTATTNFHTEGSGSVFASGFRAITTGDVSPDGATASTAAGDVRNWHKYGLEWTGTTWHYYVDGVLVQAVTETNAQVPNVGWQCFWTFGAAEASFSSFHTVWDSASHPGPYNMWISDVQFYRKPGT